MCSTRVLYSCARHVCSLCPGHVLCTLCSRYSCALVMCAGPFGPFERRVRLAHPIDISTPVEARVGHGIFEFRFLKGFIAIAPNV